MAVRRAEIPRHLRSLHGLEEKLAFEEFGEQQQRERNPWLKGSHEDSQECDDKSSPRDPP